MNGVSKLLMNRVRGFQVRLGLLVVATLALAACATSTEVDVKGTQEFPVPLVVRADLHMGIYVPEEFESYVYEDYEKVKKKKSRSEIRAAKKIAKKKAEDQKKAEQKKAEEKNAEQKETEQDKVNKKAEPSNDDDSDAEQEKAAPVLSLASADSDAQLQTDAEEQAATGKNTANANESTGSGAGSSVASSASAAAKDELRLKFRISLGEAQAKMVRTVFPGVFRQTTMLESLAPENLPDDIDFYLVPSITKVQYTTPKTTRLNVYEIWLQYTFTIYDRRGDVITRWRVPSYGKTPTAFMKSKENALQTATQMALRDCGAAFSTGFRTQPAIARWLQAREKKLEIQTTPKVAI
ncbi:MAG: hypothetical protein AB8B86_13090 [Pseudomonadales bacterium]